MGTEKRKSPVEEGDLYVGKTSGEKGAPKKRRTTKKLKNPRESIIKKKEEWKSRRPGKY